MPPKKQEPKKGKTVEKEKQKIVEDKTFGLKNKNKSKKVQSYVQQVKKQAAQKVEGNKPRRKEEEEQKKLSKKALLEARAAELGMIMKPVKEKEKTQEISEEEKRRQEEERERERIANLPLEEQIEERRKRIENSTKVTEEMFRNWLKKKAADRNSKEQKASSNKSKTSLTGRELFTKRKELFVDDEYADAEKYERPLVYEESEDEEETNGYLSDEEVKLNHIEQDKRTELEVEHLTNELNATSLDKTV
eukprot:jgi/Galph1/3255/GphlegSOOS_G1891.1